MEAVTRLQALKETFRFPFFVCPFSTISTMEPALTHQGLSVVPLANLLSALNVTAKGYNVPY